MNPNPILKVLFTLKKYRVKSLLIGGQACIIYGAAEFSRDSDFVILSTHKNLKCLQEALKALKAELIYVPPLEVDYLERGHACHFRCAAKEVEGLRIDVISKLRGCETFDKLWKRKKTVSLKNNRTIDVIGLRDLVQSKKTQRDKDWLMLKRLVDNDIILNKYSAAIDSVRWWLRECRDAGILIKLAEKYSKIAKECVKIRPLLSLAVISDMKKLNLQFHNEEMLERQKDIGYWAPLKKELEELRHKK
ncbi:MAG: hypothetical protein ABH914_02410 [Candidatus Omnitrophota bacterium]